jgi:hypothetical protein
LFRQHSSVCYLVHSISVIAGLLTICSPLASTLHMNPRASRASHTVCHGYLGSSKWPAANISPFTQCSNTSFIVINEQWGAAGLCRQRVPL